MAVQALIGWLAGDLASGLMATIGAFTSLYGSGRPYLNRGVHLGVVAVCFALAVALGDWAAEVPWAGVLTVSVIAMTAVLVCHALAVGPPGAYMFVLACATGTGVASRALGPMAYWAPRAGRGQVRLAGAHVRRADQCPRPREVRCGVCRAGGCAVRRRGRYLAGRPPRGTARRQRCISGTCWSLSSRFRPRHRAARCIPYARSIMNCTSFSRG